MNRPLLYSRNKLYVPCAQFFGNKLINFQRRFCGDVVYDCQHIYVDAVFLQQRHRLNHFVEYGFTAACFAIAIVKPCRTVNREPHQELVTCQKFCPLLVNQDTVGLHTVANGFSARVLFLQGQRGFIKTQPGQRGFAPLPGKLHLLRRISLDVLLHVAAQRVVIHVPRRLLRFQCSLFFFQIKTVIAGDIALVADGFRHEVECFFHHRPVRIKKVDCAC